MAPPLSPDLPHSDRLLLVGMMAVGKTIVGQLCAKRLGWPFLDSDVQLVAEEGRSAREIFNSDGDDVLRSVESRVLAEAIAHPTPVVVAVAGGVVLVEASRTLLVRSGVVVWLRASMTTLSERVERGGDRPRLGANPLQSLRDLYVSRHPLYAAVAGFIIDVDDLPPEEIVTRILEDTGLGIA
jgi:shikimate kinase